MTDVRDDDPPAPVPGELIGSEAVEQPAAPPQQLHPVGVELTVEHPLGMPPPSPLVGGPYDIVGVGVEPANRYVPRSLRAAERHRRARAVGSPDHPPPPPRPTYDVDNIFTYHPPIGDQPQRYAELRAKAKEYAELILKLVPGSAERTTALRRVEEATFWANAAIARHEGPSVDDQPGVD